MKIIICIWVMLAVLAIIGLYLGRLPKKDAAAIGKRASHYGDGVQPWDYILAAGWGPEFAAGNALKYVRRYKNKNGEDDLNKGRWYYHELIKMVTEARKDNPYCNAPSVFDALEFMLSMDERKLLRIT